MATLTLTIRPVPGVVPNGLRTVSFLEGDPGLTAGTEFDKVADKQPGKKLRHVMQLWIGEGIDRKGKCHRFKSRPHKYRECFVFEDTNNGIRLYGFTCHPPNDNRFELCLLTEHAFKWQWATDEAILDRVVMWQNHMAVRFALMNTYPINQDGGTKK
jgi:hypothetical protein